jgi:hypothetical protein
MKAKTIMPNIIVQCRATKLLSLVIPAPVERFALVVQILESAVFSPFK